MKTETERKFLIDCLKWNAADKPAPEYYRQGYLLTDPGKTIRVRQTDAGCWLTIKGAAVGASRPEFEYEIPKEDANRLIEDFSVSVVTKWRYKIEYKNKIWEVDVFKGENEGLIIAEVEVENETEPVELPPWVAGEVTGDEKYYNSTLSLKHLKICEYTGLTVRGLPPVYLS